jgi:hypothetical protein
VLLGSRIAAVSGRPAVDERELFVALAQSAEGEPVCFTLQEPPLPRSWSGGTAESIEAAAASPPPSPTGAPSVDGWHPLDGSVDGWTGSWPVLAGSGPKPSQNHHRTMLLTNVKYS